MPNHSTLSNNLTTQIVLILYHFPFSNLRNFVIANRARDYDRIDIKQCLDQSSFMNNIFYRYMCLQNIYITVRIRTRTVQLFFGVTALSCYSEKELNCSGPSSNMSIKHFNIFESYRMNLLLLMYLIGFCFLFYVQ